MIKKVILFIALASLGLAEERRFGFQADEWFLRWFTPEGRIVGGTEAKVGEVCEGSYLQKAASLSIPWFVSHIHPSYTFPMDAKQIRGEFPYQVSLIFTGPIGGHFCGGAIISEKVVLTAGHCVKGLVLPSWTHVEVEAGKTSLKDHGPNVQASRIKKQIVHPKYIGGTNPYDIAVLILEKPFKFTKYVQPVALPEPGESFTGNTTLSGWGSTSNTEIPIHPDKLQKVDLPLISYEQCAKMLEKSSLDKFSNLCTGPTDSNLSACTGDSGGPLTKNVSGTTTVIGLASWGQVPCGHGHPTIYTRVSSFIDFIKDNSGKSLD